MNTKSYLKYLIKDTKRKYESNKDFHIQELEFLSGQFKNAETKEDFNNEIRNLFEEIKNYTDAQLNLRKQLNILTNLLETTFKKD